jgi:ribonuclease PH
VNGDGGKWHGKFEKFYPSLEEIQGGRMHDFINRDTVLKLLEERDRGYQRLSEAIRDSLAPSDII